MFACNWEWLDEGQTGKVFWQRRRLAPELALKPACWGLCRQGQAAELELIKEELRRFEVEAACVAMHALDSWLCTLVCCCAQL